MKILILGSEGQLGSELCRLAETFDFDAEAYDLPEFDITDKSQVNYVIASKNASLIVNAAAYTAVDRAETEKETAFAVNQKAPVYLADICRRLNIPLIHISTDYVFDGSKRVSYTETDKIAPINVYGLSKAAGENEIITNMTNYIIVRTSWLYGTRGNNFVKTICRAAQEKESLNVVDDQFGSPTYAADLAEVLLKISSRYFYDGSLPWGIYHFCNDGVISWYEFAMSIVKNVSKYSALKVQHVYPIKTIDYPTPAKRPLYSALNCERIKRVFGVKQNYWKDSLAIMMERMMNQHVL